MFSATATQPKFSSLICNEQRRDPETGVRVFKYELTNDISQYPLGWVACPQSGKPGTNDPTVAFVAANLPVLAKLGKEDRLEMMRTLIRFNSRNWQIGKNKPTDFKDEVLADRGSRLLQQSTADIRQNLNGSLSMIMDYDLDQRGGSLTALLAQQQTHPPSPYYLPPPSRSNSFLPPQPYQGPPPPYSSSFQPPASFPSSTFQRVG